MRSWKKWIGLLLGMVLLLAGCSGASESDLAPFTAQTLDGGTFTQDDIAAKDVTIINFWGTYCMPCLSEMPDLAAYAKTLPDNVQLITVCVDGANDPELAGWILELSGYDGTTLIAGDENFADLCNSIQVVPTTIFMDSRGNQVGDPVIGTQESLEESYNTGVNQVLEAKTNE